MPLFDHFPYSNLHELNLDWVLKKLKDVDKAQTAAEDVLALVERAETAAESAEEDATSAHADATAAASSEENAAIYAGRAESAESLCSTSLTDTLRAAGEAANARAFAVAAKEDAEAAKDLAVGAKNDAAGSATAAAGSAAAALADANRAQAYGASTGVAALEGSITSQSSQDVSLADGTYIIVYFGTDTQNSSGIYMFTIAGSTMVRRSLVHTGANIIMSTTAANTVRIVNYMADGSMRYLIMGYMEV